MKRAMVLLIALAAAPARAPAQAPPIEPVYGVRMAAETVTVSVASNGCTRKADFTVGVLKQSPATTLLFARKRPDPCRAAPRHADLVWSLAELGLTPGEQVILANPLTGDPGP